MQVDRTELGECPSCTARIPTGYDIIRYETSEGDTEMFAECPACREIVHPQ